MSNLLKSNYVICDNNEKRIIDTNLILSSRLDYLREQVVTLEEEVVESEFVEGIQTLNLTKVQKEVEEQMQVKAESVLNEARAKALLIVEDAKKQAQIILEESKQQGYEVGYQQGVEESQHIIEQKTSEFQQKEQLLEKDYQKKVHELEPKLVEAILYVVGKVTGVLAEEKKDLILHLVNSVMNQADISEHFIIRVSKDDYNFLSSNVDRIDRVLSKQVEIQVFEDPKLTKNQCIIETDYGIFDSSLDIQLENLVKDISILASMME